MVKTAETMQKIRSGKIGLMRTARIFGVPRTGFTSEKKPSEDLLQKYKNVLSYHIKKS